MNLKNTVLALLFIANIGYCNDELQAIRDEISAMKLHYENKISSLEARLEAAEKTITEQKYTRSEDNSGAISTEVSNSNTFNPAISFIFDGRYVDYKNKYNQLQFPGYVIGPESGPEPEGFNIGESELTLSANIDDKFYGQTTIAFANDSGETEVEVEEIFIQTLALDYGFTLKAGRYFSALGYINEQHAHAWDYADAPLVYQAMLGGQLKNEGLQLTTVLPTDFYLEAGIEFGNAQNFPAAGEHNGFGSTTAFLTTGGDIGYNSSWQLGLSYWQASVKNRDGLDENPDFSYSGNNTIKAIDFVYKWSPNGNNKQQNINFQFEYLDRNEDGTLGEYSNSVDYKGNQMGWYAQAAWLFKPTWRTGIRYDTIGSDNSAFSLDRLVDAGLLSEEDQNRASIMLEWIPSEFSRLRMQYNDDVDALNPAQWTFQYTYSMGSHGAHQF